MSNWKYRLQHQSTQHIIHTNDHYEAMALLDKGYRLVPHLKGKQPRTRSFGIRPYVEKSEAS